ncbi:Ribokinase-like protein [Nemania sp. NC0429]|nr:Ribokinase-like protein [Nemania sp. NC0429]
MDRHAPEVADHRPVFVSLGMVILDELRFPHLRTVIDVPGGSGLYATFGARLFKAGPRALDVGCIVLAGYDLPESTVRLLESWGMTLLLVHDTEKPCTRGLLKYEDDTFGRNTFSYVTPPLRPSPAQLGASSLLYAASFHFLSLPADLESEVSTLLRLREEKGVTERPLIVWEPAPFGCDSANLTSHLKACALVDVFSPNHSELRYLLEGKNDTQAEFSPSQVEAQAAKFVEAGIGPNHRGLAVIRSGEHGALILSNDRPAEWIPTYYGQGAEEVVDATGAGNAFLGAFAVALHETNDPREACLRGSIAASYALEQVGPPKLAASSSLSGELWNGSDVQTRLQEFKARISKV